MAKAIYIDPSVGLYVTMYVCMYVCMFVSLTLYFETFFHYNFFITNAVTFIFYHVTYFYEPFLTLKKFQGQGQRSRSWWPDSPNHVNQFFSKSKNIVFFKLGEKLVLGLVHNRLDFGKNRSRHSGSRTGQALTFKMTFTTTSTYYIV